MIALFYLPPTPESPFLNGTTPVKQIIVKEKVKALVPTIITPAMTDLEKQTAIHDWLLANIEFDDSLQDIDAYSAITKGKTVCGGYATLNALMLEQAGICSKVVRGNTVHDMSYAHAWNLVNIDGEWLHTDVTWCDVEGKEFAYFNKTDNYMLTEGYFWDVEKYSNS